MENMLTRLKPKEGSCLHGCELLLLEIDGTRMSACHVTSDQATSSDVTRLEGKRREGVHDDERTPREVLITNSMDEDCLAKLGGEGGKASRAWLFNYVAASTA